MRTMLIYGATGKAGRLVMERKALFFNYRRRWSRLRSG